MKRRLFTELLQKGAGGLGAILLAAAVSLSTDGKNHSLVTYLGFYGFGLALVVFSVVLLLWLHAGEKATARPSLWRRHPVVALLILAVLVPVVGLAGGLIVAAGDDGGQPCSRQALTKPSGLDQEVRRISRPSTGQPRAGKPIEMRPHPRSLAVGSEGVWVTQSKDRSVALIDPQSSEPIGKPFPVGGIPYSIALAEEVIWVSREDGWVVAIDRQTGKVVRRYDYGTESGEVTVGGGSVWVNNWESLLPGVVTRIDPCSGETSKIEVGERATTVRFAFGAVWVSDLEMSALHRIDPITEKTEAIALPSSADLQDIGDGGGYIWVVSFGPRDLFKVNPRKKELVGDPIPIGPGAAGAVVAAGSIWLPNYKGNSVTRVDLQTLESEPEAVRVGEGPTDIAAGFGRIWVANYDSEPPSVTPIRP